MLSNGNNSLRIERLRSSFIAYKDVVKFVPSSRVSKAQQKVLQLIEGVLVIPPLPEHCGDGSSGTCVNFALNTCLTLHEAPRNVTESVPLQLRQCCYFSVTNDSFFPLNHLQVHCHTPMAKVYCCLFENVYEITVKRQRDFRCL